jgi:hypothetical protein
MDNQITSIAIKIGELEIKSSISFWIAIIGALTAIFSAIIAGISAWKLNCANKQHQKQWAYVGKVSTLIDNGIDIFARLLFNKLLIAYNVDVQVANNNLFLLQKDILVIESQLIVYGSLELGDAVYSFKNIIIQTKNEEFISKWDSIYQEGHKLLLLCRTELGEKISEKFEDFAQKLVSVPPKLSEGTPFDAKLISSTKSTTQIEKV